MNTEMNFLIVDDIHTNVVIMQIMLNGLLKDLLGVGNFKIDTAYDGVDALEKTRAKKYLIIFMDINMPRMNGIESGRQIKIENYGQNPPTSIIAVTAGDINSIDKDAFDAICGKPINAKIIHKEIENILNSVSC